VAAYSYHPNWQARVNGKQADIYRVNSQLMAVAVPAGSSTVEFLYQNNYVVLGSAIKIIFALLAIGFILFRIKPGGHASLLMIVLAIMVWKNSYSLPFIKNSNIPEKPLRSDITVADTTGLYRIDSSNRSGTIEGMQTFNGSFISPLNGLRKIVIRLNTGDFSLDNGRDFKVQISVRELHTGKTSSYSVNASQLRGINWHEISLDEYPNSKNRVYQITVSASEATTNDNFSIHLTEENKISIITYHNPAIAYNQ
jgi:hypothetical protein